MPCFLQDFAPADCFLSLQIVCARDNPLSEQLDRQPLVEQPLLDGLEVDVAIRLRQHADGVEGFRLPLDDDDALRLVLHIQRALRDAEGVHVLAQRRFGRARMYSTG